MKEIDEYFKPYRDLKSRIREKKYELEELEKNMYYANEQSRKLNRLEKERNRK